MKHFDPVPAPQGFLDGAPEHAAWLENNPGAKRPRDYWSDYRDDLADGFGDLCAYTVMYCPNGTVDHFVSWDEDNTRAYDWSNYRYAAGWYNSSKQNLESNQLLDPLAVEDGWFEIILPSMQLVATDAVPENMRERAEFMLERGRLGHDERVLRVRRQWYKLYRAKKLPLAGLRELAPLIAAAVESAEREQGQANQRSRLGSSPDPS